jgi:hypothetical protein
MLSLTQTQPRKYPTIKSVTFSGMGLPYHFSLVTLVTVLQRVFPNLQGLYLYAMEGISHEEQHTKDVLGVAIVYHHHPHIMCNRIMRSDTYIPGLV